MKNSKFICTLCIITALFALFTFSSSAESANAGAPGSGDVNCDGKLTAADARLALRYSAKLEKLSEIQIAAADVDGKKGVTAADARMILRAAAGLSHINGDSIAKDYIIENGVLHIAVCPDNPPFAYKENGELKGFDIEYAEQLAKSIDLKAVFHEMSANEFRQSLDNRECDIAFGITAAESDGALKSSAYFSNTVYVLARDGSGINSWSDVTGNVGVIKNSYAYYYAAEKGIDESKIKTYEDCLSAQHALSNDAIQLVITSDRSAFYAISESVNVISLEQTETNYFLFAAENNAPLMNIINGAISRNSTNFLKDKYIEHIKEGEIRTDVSSVTMSPGGVGMFEVEIYAPYDYIYLDVSDKTKQDFVISVNQDSENYNKYTILFALKGNKSTQIELNMDTYSMKKSLSVPVYAVSNPYATYPMTDTATIDFGAYTRTAPYDMRKATANGITIMYFDYYANELLENGAGEDVIDRYIAKMEKRGFVYAGEAMIDYDMLGIDYFKESNGDEFMIGLQYTDDGYINSVRIFVLYYE